MKKIVKRDIIAFVLGALIFGSIGGVAAYTYNASQIVYNPSDPNWNVRNVSDAITSIRDSKVSSNYSTSEKKIGTWIDGKPVYQKVFLLENGHEAFSANTWESLLSVNISIDKVIYGTIISGDSTRPSELKYLSLTYNKSNNTIEAIHTRNTAIVIANDSYIILQYTKTTDQATN